MQGDPQEPSGQRCDPAPAAVQRHEQASDVVGTAQQPYVNHKDGSQETESDPADQDTAQQPAQPDPVLPDVQHAAA